MRQLAALGRNRRASISVEFALVSVFVLLPLIAGGADFVEIISAQSELNAALQSLYYFAWNNPANATNTAQLGGILAIGNQHSLPQITFPDGRANGTTTYVPTLSYGCAANPTANVTYQATPCAAGQTQQTLITYNLITKVDLPAPLPFALTNPYPLAVTGKIQIQ